MKTCLNNLASTRAFALRFAKKLKAGDLVLLSGELGAGKTTFVGFLAVALGIDRRWVSSPSFVLVQRYPGVGSGISITHVDLYRLGESHDLEELGLDEVLASNDLVVVEWPNCAESLWASSGRRTWKIVFEIAADGARCVMVNAENREAALL